MSTKFSPRVATAALLIASSSLAGCGAPDLGPRPELRPPSTLDSAASIQGTAAEWPQERWWTAYGDPQLDGLVDEAIKGSPDVATALARIRQAQGALESSRAALLPSIGGQGSASVEKQSYNNGTPVAALPKGWKDYGMLALSANLNLDIWGKNRALLAAATSAAEAAVADERQAELVLASEVVSSYFDLGRLLERQKVLDETLAAREGSAKLVGQRVTQGLDNQSPLRQSNAEAARARIDVAANREQIEKRRHALAALLGAGPDRTLTLTPPVHRDHRRDAGAGRCGHRARRSSPRHRHVAQAGASGRQGRRVCEEVVPSRHLAERPHRPQLAGHLALVRRRFGLWQRGCGGEPADLPGRRAFGSLSPGTRRLRHDGRQLQQVGDRCAAGSRRRAFHPHFGR
ncbi:RND efflux system outer membrane lipoprotein [Sphingomonas sp. LH128]|nr:RND efflux system outer membrane lipoprotein [Sphingomonas sp. LH128]